MPRRTTKKAAASKLPVKFAAPAAAPAFRPVVHVPVLMVPQGNGEFLVKSGKPVVATDEVGTREFAKLTGLSQRHVVTLCDEGRLKCRRKSSLKKSEYLIPREEAARLLQADPHEP